MRADRLLSIMLLLDTHRHLTAGDLAHRLELSERTIYRDIDALSAAGVPVYAQRGGRGGCYLPDGYRTRLTGLTAAEAQVLSVPGPAQVLADLGLREAVDTAQMKLMRALPDGVRRSATAAHERVLVEAAGWDPPQESVPHLEALQSAVWLERQLEVVYCRSDGTTVERRVDPLGLVAKGSVWYLVAAVAGEIRVYRVARLIDVRVLDHSIVRPPGFDLAVYWRQTSAAFKANIPRVTVLVRVAPPAMAAVRSARAVCGAPRGGQAGGRDGRAVYSSAGRRTAGRRTRSALMPPKVPSFLRDSALRIRIDARELQRSSRNTQHRIQKYRHRQLSALFETVSQPSVPSGYPGWPSVRTDEGCR